MSGGWGLAGWRNSETLFGEMQDVELLAFDAILQALQEAPESVGWN